MKRKIITATIFYLIFFLSFWLMACKSVPPKVETKYVEIKVFDSSAVVKERTRSKAIADSLKIYIDQIKTAKPECDSVCQEAMDRILSNLNNRKSSGGNSFGVYYDKYQKAIIAHANLEETISEKNDSIRILKQSSKRFEKIEVPVPAKFSKEQNFNLWTGRLFWLAVAIFIFYIIRRKISIWHNLKKSS